MRRDADRGQGEHPVGDDRPGDAAGDLGRDVGQRDTPGQSAESGVHERDEGVEMTARDRAEHEDDRGQAAAVAAAFSSSCRPGSLESSAAAIPEPMTSAARKALPRNSASRRRESGIVTGR